MDTTEHAMRVASAAGTNIQQPEKTREANNFNKPKKKEKKKHEYRTAVMYRSNVPGTLRV